MPIYEYRCEDGHITDVIQKMADDPLSVCEVCGKPVQRVFHPVAVHYKGSGFYSTDYGKKRGATGEAGSSSADSGEGGTTDKSTKTEPDKKSDPKSGDKGDSGGSGDKGDKKKSDSKSSD